MHDYVVHLVVESDGGAVSYEFHVQDGDAPDLAAGPVVLDGLSFGWEFAGEDWPPTLQAMTGTAQLLAQDVADLADLDTAQRVAVVVMDGTTNLVIGRLYGRVSELTADHIRRPDPANPAVDILWTRYTMSLVDFLPTLDLPILRDKYGDGFGDDLPGPVNTLLLDMPTDEIGTLRTDLLSYGGGSGEIIGAVWVNPYQVNPGTWSAGTVVQEVQQKVLPIGLGYDSNGEPHFHVAMPVADIADLSTFSAAPVADHVGLQALRGPFSSELPCTFTVISGLLHLTPLPDRPNCLDAGRITEFGQWRRDGTRSVGAVTIYRQTADSRTTVKAAGAGQDYRTREIEADLTTAAAARELAEAYLVGDAAEIQPAWELESFTLRPETALELADQDNSVYSDFWVPAAWTSDPWPYDGFVSDRYAWTDWEGGTPGHPAPAAMRAPVAIFGLQNRANLSRQSPGYYQPGELYTGTLSGARMTISGGEVSVTFALRRRIPRPERDGVEYGPAEGGTGYPVKNASYSWLRSDPSLSVVQFRAAFPRVGATLTIRDARLVRRP